jgi:hypothetical protein
LLSSGYENWNGNKVAACLCSWVVILHIEMKQKMSLVQWPLIALQLGHHEGLAHFQGEGKWGQMSTYPLMRFLINKEYKEWHSTTCQTYSLEGESTLATSAMTASKAASNVCKHKCFLASMFYQNIGPSSVHVFHMYGVYFSSKKPVIF